MACRKALVPWPGIEPGPSTGETAREVPQFFQWVLTGHFADHPPCSLSWHPLNLSVSLQHTVLWGGKWKKQMSKCCESLSKWQLQIHTQKGVSGSEQWDSQYKLMFRTPQWVSWVRKHIPRCLGQECSQGVGWGVEGSTPFLTPKPYLGSLRITLEDENVEVSENLEVARVVVMVVFSH